MDVWEKMSKAAQDAHKAKFKAWKENQQAERRANAAARDTPPPASPPAPPSPSQPAVSAQDEPGQLLRNLVSVQRSAREASSSGEIMVLNGISYRRCNVSQRTYRV